MKLKLYTVLVTLAFSVSAFGWGSRGHDAVARIAELNLNPQTRQIVEGYLDGRSIVYYASWPDRIRFDHEYQLEYAGFAHTASYDAECRHAPVQGTPDAVLQISGIMENLGNGRYRNMPDSMVVVAIRYLTHAVGDMHCPGHCKVEGRESNFRITHGGAKLRMHTFWDDMPERAHSWGYLEYGHQLSRLSPERAAEVVRGSVKDWGEDAAMESAAVYECVEDGGELGKPYVVRFTPVMDDLITKAGYRLAHVLNTIFNQ